MQKIVLAITVLAAFFSAGCSGMRLYDKQADQQASSIRADYDAGKILEVVASERANVAALEKKEIDAFVKTTLVERDLVILGLVSDGDAPFTTKFETFTEERLEAIASSTGVDGKTPPIREQILDLRAERRELHDATRDESRIREQLGRIDIRFGKLPACIEGNRSALRLPPAPPAPPAPTPLAPPPAITTLRSEAEASLNSALAGSTFATPNETLDVYRQYIDVCRTALDSAKSIESKVVALGVGLLKSTSDSLRGSEEKLKTDEAAATAAKTDLKKATDEETARVTASASVAKEAATDFTCADKKPEDKNDICKALEKLSGLGDLGKKIVSEEKVNRINTLLAALSGQYEPEKDEEVERSLAFVSAATRLHDALSAYRKAKTLPPLEPLIIEKQIAIVQLAQARQAADLQVARVGYRREMHEAVLEEAFSLLRAKGEVANLKPATKCKSVKATVGCGSVQMLLLGTGLSDDRVAKRESPVRSVYRALSAISESYSVARVRYITAEMRLVLSPYRESLIQSEASLVAWNSLIDTPLKQIKTWYADGLKPDEIAQFLQAFGLLGIADRIKK